MDKLSSPESLIYNAIDNFDLWLSNILHARKWTGPNVLIWLIMRIENLDSHCHSFNPSDFVLPPPFPGIILMKRVKGLKLFKRILFDKNRASFRAMQFITHDTSLTVIQMSQCLKIFVTFSKKSNLQSAFVQPGWVMTIKFIVCGLMCFQIQRISTSYKITIRYHANDHYKSCIKRIGWDYTKHSRFTCWNMEWIIPYIQSIQETNAFQSSPP